MSFRLKLTINEAGTITSYNMAAETLFGWSANEALDQPISILMPEYEASRHHAYLDRYRMTGQRQAGPSRKTASLGGLVTSVAHEINTPVGFSMTAASHLQDAAEIE